MKKVKKPFSVLLTLSLSFCLMAIVSTTAYAHEIWVDSSGNPISLRWINKYPYNTTYYHVAVSSELLSDNTVYRDNVPEAIHEWTANPTLSYATGASFSDSNVDCVTMTKDYWDQEGYPYGALAITWDYDTYGTAILSPTDAAYSSRQISYAAIYFNPYHDKNFLGIAPGIVGNQRQQKGVVTHEIGHVYCLGHPDTTYNIFTGPSLMRSIASNSMSAWLEQHDIDDMNTKYR
jgi:hypothetical protein